MILGLEFMVETVGWQCASASCAPRPQNTLQEGSDRTEDLTTNPGALAEAFEELMSQSDVGVAVGFLDVASSPARADFKT